MLDKIDNFVLALKIRAVEFHARRVVKGGNPQLFDVFVIGGGGGGHFDIGPYCRGQRVARKAGEHHLILRRNRGNVEILDFLLYIVGGFEFVPRENVGVGVLLLSLDNVGLIVLFHDIIGKLGKITHRSADKIAHL